MKILHTVEFYEPHVGGSEEVVRQISEGLVRRGHQVMVATTKDNSRGSTLINGVSVQEFDVSGNEVRGYHGETRAYQEFLRDGKFDLMMNYSAQQWTSDLVFPILESLPYRKLLIPCGFMSLNTPQYYDFYQKMPSVLQKYDHLVFHSNAYRDIAFARQHGLSSYTVIPNGASDSEFSSHETDFRTKYKIQYDIPLLLTVGNHTGIKGHKLTIEAFRKARIGPAVLLILGGLQESTGCVSSCRREARLTSTLSLGRKQVKLLDIPRSDVVAAFKAADLFVFCSNIEYSPLVLFEAMASKTPFITTACGNAEEIVAWGNGGVVIPSQVASDGYVTARSEDVAKLIEDLAHDEAKRHAMGLNGYQAWVEKFSWDKLVTNYEEVYRRVIEPL